MLEGEEVFVAPGAGEGFDEGGFVSLAVGMAVGSQNFGVTLAGDNGPQNLLTRYRVTSQAVF